MNSLSPLSPVGEENQRLIRDKFNQIKRRYEQHSRDGIIVWVNGKRIQIDIGSISAEETVLNFLRNRLHLTSCKLGCGEGGCGACTVTVSQFDEIENRVLHKSVNGCLTPILSLHGAAITTAEGICSTTALHPIQRVLSDAHGSQCGFCTPGIVMSMYSKWMDESEKRIRMMGTTQLGRLSVNDIEDVLDGNLCRCTGYRPIVEGFMKLTVGKSGGKLLNGKTLEPSFSHVINTEQLERLPVTRTVVSELDTTQASSIESVEVVSELRMGRKRSFPLYESYNNSDPIDDCITLNSVNYITESVMEDYDIKKSIEWLVLHEAQQEQLGNHLRLLNTVKMSLYFKARYLGQIVTWITTTSLEDLLVIMEQMKLINHRYKLLEGNTERHIERVYKRTHQYPLTLISIAKVGELNQFKWTSTGVQIGCGYPINKIVTRFKERLNNEDYSNTNSADIRILTAYIQQIRWFAGCQIRNVACLGGNIATASPISDLNPLHLAAGVVLTIAKLEIDEISGAFNIVMRDKPMVENFFQGYRRIDLGPTEIIVSIFIPLFNSLNFHLFGFKQSRRREDDIAIVNAGMSVLFEDAIKTHDKVPIVKQLVVSYGGMAPMTITLSELSNYWKNQPWNLQTLIQSLPLLQQLTDLAPNTPGGQVKYRMRLARNFFLKFFFQVSNEAGLTLQDLIDSIPIDFKFINPLLLPFLNNSMLTFTSDLYPLPHHTTYLYQRDQPITGFQNFGRNRDSLSKKIVAGQCCKHMAGDLHVTGKAIYIDDKSTMADELYAILLISTEAHAQLINIDLSECKQVVGYAGFCGYEDIQGDTKIGSIFLDEEVFASKEVYSVGQPIGIVLGNTHDAARDAAARIRIEYNKLESILSLEDSIQKGNFYDVDFEGRKQLVIEVTNRSSNGFNEPIQYFNNVDSIWHYLGIELPESKGLYPLINDVSQSMTPRTEVSSCGRFIIVSGGIRMGGQEHFYLEPQSCQIVPSENDSLTVFSSTQDPAKTQSLVSAVTGIPKHKIICKCKRMGGGFGGKETRSSFFAAYVSVAVQKFQRPVRMILDRDVDFQCSGQRHTFLSFYRVAIEKSTKKFLVGDLQLFNDAGWSTDLSVPVMERALFHCENCYYFPNFRVIGRCCKTNLPTNTAFRGFGGPQGMFVAETYVEHCAAALGCHSDEIRELNFYKHGDLTHYQSPMEEPFLQRMFKELKETCNYDERWRNIEEFNRKNLWVKKGIRIIPVKFGMSFTKAFMNQAGSLVHVYTDGTVLVSHTGTEMGQGLNTKIAQITATVFDLPLTSINIDETSTDKVANGMPTAASSGTDLNGMATFKACHQILDRLKPYIKAEREARKISVIEHLDDETKKEIFKRAAFKAHIDRVNLSANGFYMTPDINYSFLTNTGKPFHYNVCAMACTEVEVDTLTGDHKVVRADLIEDAGESLNPAIDIGQIEGAFIQGLGLFTLEEIITMPDGSMFTRGPSGYKIPAFGDIPIDFRVSLLEEVKNPAIPSVYSSKGVGEPPLFLASSAFFAIRAAIESKRLDLIDSAKAIHRVVSLHDDESLFPMHHTADIGTTSTYSMNVRHWFMFNSPATSERICNACHRE